ncbi:MAG: hypothetical protein GVY13_03415 [Alphaproteobacteria bacterium]|jgi:hypothetical protein|nr:hypothetical protein [Alphaproteobacteria bacterium]
MTTRSKPGFSSPAPGHRQSAGRRAGVAQDAQDWRKRTWFAWGILALIWFVGATAYFGFGADRNFPVSSRPAPLLSGVECNRVVDIDGQRSCMGVANLSRERRIMLQDREADRSVHAGTAILGPPLLSLLGVFLLTRYVGREPPVPARAPRPRHGFAPGRR